MNLLAQQSNPKIPVSLLMLSMAIGFSEEMRAQTLRHSNRIDELRPECDVDRSSEEPERWDGMS